MKTRDAYIRLSSAEQEAVRESLGIVPLFNVSLLWRFHERVGLLFEGDALAGAGGRAEDLRIAVSTEVTDDLSIRLGYRILEGGAGNSRVYGFALFHYLSAGVLYVF